MTRDEGPREPLPLDVQRVVEALRRSNSPPPGAKDRVRARLALTLALPDLGGSSGPTGGSPGPGDGGVSAVGGSAAVGSSTIAGVSIKTLASIMAVSAVVTGVTVGMVPTRVGPAPTAVSAPAVPAAPVASPALAPSTHPAPEDPPASPPRERETTLRKRVAPASLPRAEHSTAQSGLAQERRILDAARSFLAQGHVSAALQSLDDHRRHHAVGQLTEEREALLVMVLARAGRLDEAHRAQERFRRDFPGSLFHPAVESALGRTPHGSDQTP